MVERSPQEIAKWHCLDALFGATTGRDPYLAAQIKKAIESHLKTDSVGEENLEAFTDMACNLFSKQEMLPASYGVAHIDLRGKNYDPLWLHGEIRAALRRLAGFEEALLIISGIRDALCPEGRYWTRRLQRRHQEIRDHLDALAERWSTPSCRLTLLYL